MAKKAKKLIKPVNNFSEFSAEAIRTINRAKPHTFMLTPKHMALVQTAAALSDMSWREFVALAVVSQARATMDARMPLVMEHVDYVALYENPTEK